MENRGRLSEAKTEHLKTVSREVTMGIRTATFNRRKHEHRRSCVYVMVLGELFSLFFHSILMNFKWP